MRSCKSALSLTGRIGRGCSGDGGMELFKYRSKGGYASFNALPVINAVDDGIKPSDIIDGGRGTGTKGRGYDESGERPFDGDRERERERDRSQTEHPYGTADDSTLNFLFGGGSLNVTGDRVLPARVLVPVTRLERLLGEEGDRLVFL